MTADKNLKITSDYVRMICQIIAQDEVDFVRYLNAVGITNSIVDSHKKWVDFNLFCDAVSDFQKDMPDYPVGLIVGSKLHISAHGIVSLAALSSDTVRQGLDAIGKYISTQEPFFIIKTSTDTECMHIDIVMSESKTRSQRTFIETAILVVKNAIAQLSGIQTHKESIQLSYPAPRCIEHYQQYFPNDVIIFNSDKNRIS